MDAGAHRVAVVDIGTNSTRLLVADVTGGRVAEVERHSRVTRLGRGVDLSGQLSAEAIEAACEAIADYVALYQEAGVERSTRSRPAPSATPPTASAFVAELRERFALSARVLDGEEEARLTYLGATTEHPPAEPTLVIDIGGGSTELIVGTATRDRLPHLAAGRRRPPYRAPHLQRPAQPRSSSRRSPPTCAA